MTLIYTSKLDFIIPKTDIKAQKIEGSTFTIYRIVIIGFLLQDNFKKIRFFEKIFLLADIS